MSGDGPDPDSGGDASEEAPDAPWDGDLDTFREDGGEGDLEGGDGDADADGDADDAGDVPCLCLDDLDCADLEPCNGGEQCVDCACRPGIPPADGFPCDDGDSCTAGEGCTGGVCAGGDPVCLCTTDDDCLAYDDGDRCNGRPLCVGRSCVFDPATVVMCDTSGDTACLVNRCVPASGESVPAPVPDGTACGNACTAGEGVYGRSCGAASRPASASWTRTARPTRMGTRATEPAVRPQRLHEVDPATVVSCDRREPVLANRCDPGTGVCLPRRGLLVR